MITASPARMLVPLLLLVAVGLALRLPQLDRRPLHTDEAVNAVILGEMLEGGTYRFDPQDRHGPALYYAAQPLVRLLGATNLRTLDESMLRLTPVWMGAVALLALGLLARGLGWGGILAAAALWVVLPVSLYFNRDFIHESGFLAAAVLAAGCGLRAAAGPSLGWALAAGAAAGLMLSFKETAVLSFAAAAPALLALGWTPLRNRRRLFYVAAAGFLAVVVVLFSSFGRNPAGLLQLLHSFGRFAARAGGEGHEKPFSYFVTLLGGGWGGVPFLLAAAAGAGLAWRRGGFARFVAVYAAAILLLYSLIPYKTPWLALNIALPLALLAGLALAALPRLPAAAALLALLALLARDDRKFVFTRYVDERNPYAYSQNTDDILRLAPSLEDLLRTHPRGRLATIGVVAADPWPLPWYLRQLPRVGYWQPGQDVPPVDLTITDLDVAAEQAERFRGLVPDFYGVRPNVMFVLWRKLPDETPAAP